jgi:hypothetical protein
MTSAAKPSSALLVAVALTLACGGDQPAAPPEIDSAPAENAAIATGGAPRIAADEAVFDFGAIKATDSVEHVFKIRNAGDADLKVERVQKT